MQLEFHQLDRRWEHLRARRPERQRRLLASLAASGQQTPIVVVALASQPDRYLVIDGYQRLVALEQLGRDTVEAVVWPLSEAEALVLDRSLRWGERETALEEGWLLAELEQHFGYGLEELARRFDRSLSWVSRRLALVELLPESVQQQVRQRRDLGSGGDEVFGAGGALQPRGLPAARRRVGHPPLHQPRSRAVVCGLARRLRFRSATDSRTAAVVSQSATAAPTRSSFAGHRRTVARSRDGGRHHPPCQPATDGRHGRDGSPPVRCKCGTPSIAPATNSIVWPPKSHPKKHHPVATGGSRC